MNHDILHYIDRYSRHRPWLMWLINAGLMVFVTLVLVMNTEAPVVLYQAF